MSVLESRYAEAVVLLFAPGHLVTLATAVDLECTANSQAEMYVVYFNILKSKTLSLKYSRN